MGDESKKGNEKQDPKKLSMGGFGKLDPDYEQSDVEDEDSSSDSNDS